MKVRKFSLVVTDENGIEVGKKELIVDWSPGIESELKELHNVNIKDEVVRSLSDEIKTCVTPDFVRELL